MSNLPLSIARKNSGSLRINHDYRLSVFEDALITYSNTDIAGAWLK